MTQKIEIKTENVYRDKKGSEEGKKSNEKSNK